MTDATAPETANAGAERIERAMRDHGHRAAFMPYMMGGFPTLETSLAIGRGYIAGGADVIELGVPYSDPLADGPVIQDAGTVALDAGATFAKIMTVCAELSADVPIVIMTYANIVQARGVERFCEQLVEAGASGVIVPDLPVDEATELIEEANRVGLAFVPLIAPTTPDDRLELVGGRARGFLYTVSAMGVTGERSGDSGYGAILDRARSSTSVPVALGFGISGPEQGRAAADAGADGVIVGSKLVRIAAESDDPAAAVEVFVRDMVDALSD